jgi:hypothetical protein
MSVLRIGAGIILGLYALVLVHLGGKDVWNWHLTRSGDAYYVVFDYLSQGLTILLPSLLALAIVIYVLVRRRAHSAWLIVPLALELLMAVVIPSLTFSPERAARAQMAARVRNVAAALETWSAETGRYPATDAELEGVIERFLGLEASPAARLSPFARGGERIPYRIVHLPGAGGPYLPPPEAPGVIYVAIWWDLEKLWLTATTLDTAVGGKVVVFEFEGGVPWIELKVSKPAPEASP